MNRNIAELRETVVKLTQLLANKKLLVTQMGDGAWVKSDTRTGEPIQVNIPNIPDNADDALITAIQGFIDHEVAHILFTDFKLLGGLNKSLHNVHNMVEDTMIERKMGELFPGSRSNLKRTGSFFLDRITKPALKKVVGNEREEFAWLMVPTLRALSGQIVFQDFMDDGGYWKHPFVAELVARMSDETKKRLPICANTSEAVELAREIEGIVNPKKPHLPPAPPEQDEDESEEKDDAAGDGAGKGEKEHEEDSDNASSPDENDGEDGRADESDEDGESEGSAPSEDGEDDAETADEAEAEDDDAGQGADAGDDDDADGDEDEDAAGDSAQSDEDEGSDDGEDAGGDEASQGEAGSDEDASGSDGVDEDASDAAADEDEGASGGDDGESDDEDDAGTNGLSGTDEGEKEEDADGSEEKAEGAGEGDEETSQSDEPEAEEDGEDESDEGDHDAPPNELEQGANTLDTPDGDEDGEAGKGSCFSPDELIDTSGLDLSAAVATVIASGALSALLSAPYTVFSRDFDKVEVLEPTDAYKDHWLPQMEEETRSMVGKMQKDVERMMAAQSRTIRVGMQRRGRLNAPALHRLFAGDDRVFAHKEEHRSKDTAVTLLIDNSGSMKGLKFTVGMIAGYALSSTLDRVNIVNEAIGFTTAWSMTLPQAAGEAMRSARAKGIQFSREVPIHMPIFKEFDERLTPTVKKRFAFGAYAQPGCGGNVDGESIEIAANRLLKRREKRKVMIVLSDGAPAGGCPIAIPRHLRSTVLDCTKRGIDMVGIGIMDDSVKHYYPNNTVLKNLNDLPGQVMSELKRILA